MQDVGGDFEPIDSHVAAVLDEVGRVLGTEEFTASAPGYRRLLQWMRASGDVIAVGVEGTGSWGAGLARSIMGEGVSVIEVTRDRIASIVAATASPTPADAIRLLRVARRSAIKARTQPPTSSTP